MVAAAGFSMATRADVCTVIRSSRIVVWADSTVYIECDMRVLLFADTGASWRMASSVVVVPWSICVSSNSVGLSLVFSIHQLCL